MVWGAEERVDLGRGGGPVGLMLSPGLARWTLTCRECLSSTSKQRPELESKSKGKDQDSWSLTLDVNPTSQCTSTLRE